MDYDTTLKELFQTPPLRLLELLAGSPPVELLTVEYPAVRVRRPDLVARLADGRLDHLELQSFPDAQMAWRMLEYYALICQMFGQPPIQHVLYVGRRAPHLPAGLTHDNLTYRYGVIDIREVEAARLLESDSLADNLIAVLCRSDRMQEVIRRILARIAMLPHKAQLDRLAQLMILSGLRDLQDVVQTEASQMPITLDITENSFLRQVFHDGEKAMLRRMLGRMLERRFGPLPEWALTRLDEADTETLERWGLQLLEATNLGAALQ